MAHLLLWQLSQTKTVFILTFRNGTNRRVCFLRGGYDVVGRQSRVKDG